MKCNSWDAGPFYKGFHKPEMYISQITNIIPNFAFKSPNSDPPPQIFFGHFPKEEQIYYIWEFWRPFSRKTVKNEKFSSRLLGVRGGGPELAVAFQRPGECEGSSGECCPSEACLETPISDHPNTNLLIKVIFVFC